VRLSAKESAVLLVAESPETSSALVAVVHERSQARRSRFTLLVPAVAHGLHRVVDPEDQCCEEAEETIRTLRPAVEAAAGESISTMIGSHEPLAAIEDAVNQGDFDEIVLAMPSSHLARMAHLDLASKVKALGLPVTTVPLVSVSPARRHRRAATEADTQRANARRPWPHSRQDAEVEEIVRVLSSYRVLTRRRLSEFCGGAHWSDAGFTQALARATSSGRVRRLGEDLYEISETDSD
jgi:hypothetical protein